MIRLQAAPISTARLGLEPLAVRHAAEMVPVLAGRGLYRYIGGTAPTAAELGTRYAVQAGGGPPDGRESWLNWIIRYTAAGAPGPAAGFVQATVSAVDPRPTAYVAWVVGEEFQGRGIATEAARAMAVWLKARTRGSIAAYIHPENLASAAVAAKLGLAGTGRLDEDGEEIWKERVSQEASGTPAPAR